ncbi:hypothetical protein TWF730_009238 [Orbilia blumenaviensis]|uniref:Uncharacterized protein n=1 Tax=Orbilia blumenaviensis TaxID=1796055 RepID=A0AAV9V4A6_9PEZI
MVWDYNDRTPPLQPAAAKLRFVPPLVLGSSNIPHVVWGIDAEICHEVPSMIWDSMEILVPKAYLQAAAERLTKSLPIFTQIVFPLDQDQLLPHYSDDCILLASAKKLRTTANYIILIPDTVFHFDTTNPTSIMKPPSYFELPLKYNEVGVPTFSSLLDALLACRNETKTQHFTGFEKGRWRMSGLKRRFLTEATTLVA